MDLGALLHGTNPLFMDVALLIGRVSIGVCFMIHAFADSYAHVKPPPENPEAYGSLVGHGFDRCVRYVERR